MKKVIYVRFSSEKQKDGLSVDYQLDMINSKFNVNQNNALILVDKGYSGSDTNRPSYKELLKLLALEQIDLYVYRQDRLNRNIINQSILLEQLKINNSKLNMVDGDVDLDDVNGEFIFNIGSLLAQQERQLISKRTQDALMTLHKQGKHTGGKPPLGVSVDSNGYYYYNEDICIVKDIFNLYFKKLESAKNVVTSINQKYNLSLNVNTIYKIINNPIYQGYKILNDVKVEVIDTPVITSKEFNQAQINREKILRTYEKVVHKHSYLFKNITKINNNTCYVDCKIKNNGKTYKYYKDKQGFSISEIQLEKIIKKQLELDIDISKEKLDIIKYTQLENWKEVKSLIRKVEKVKTKVDWDLLTNIEINTNTNTLKFIYDEKLYIVNEFN